MKTLKIHMAVRGVDGKKRWYTDMVNDTMFNVATQHVPNMLRAVKTEMTAGDDIVEIVIHPENDK